MIGLQKAEVGMAGGLSTDLVEKVTAAALIHEALGLHQPFY